MLISRDTDAYRAAVAKLPEKFRKTHSGQDSWKAFRGTADEEIGRYLASVEGDLTWKQLFRLFKKKLARVLKDKDL